MNYLLCTTVLLARKFLLLLKTRKHPYPIVSLFKSLGYLAYILPRAHDSFLSQQYETSKVACNISNYATVSSLCNWNLYDEALQRWKSCLNSDSEICRFLHVVCRIKICYNKNQRTTTCQPTKKVKDECFLWSDKKERLTNNFPFNTHKQLTIFSLILW